MPSPTPVSAPPSRTPPDLKWLLNERAALVGLRNRSAERITYREARASRLEALLAASRQRVEAAERERAALEDRIQALDATIQLAYPRVRSDAAGCVHPRAGRYGDHGALTDFVRQVVRDMAPDPISGAQLKRLAISAFQLNIRTPAEMRSLKASIRSALMRLLAQEDAVVAERKGPKLTLWRWKAQATLDDLRALEQAASGVAGPPHDPPNPLPL